METIDMLAQGRPLGTEYIRDLQDGTLHDPDLRRSATLDGVAGGGRPTPVIADPEIAARKQPLAASGSLVGN